MLYEVPSISKAKKEVFMLLKNELNARRVWIYPITDTLVLAFPEPPKPEQLAFGKLVKKKLDSNFLALTVCDDSICSVVKRGDKIEKFVVPFNKDALLSILNAGKGLDVLVVAGEGNQKLIELLKEAIAYISPAPKVKQAKVNVNEEDLKEVLTEKELKEILKEYWEKTRSSRAFKLGVVGVTAGVFLLAGYEGFQYYLKYRKEHSQKTQIKPQEPPVAYFYYGLSAYELLKEAEKDPDSKLLAFNYDTDSHRLSYVVEGKPKTLKDFPAFKISPYRVFDDTIDRQMAGNLMFGIKVQKTIRIKTFTPKDVFSFYDGQGSLDSFFFYVPDVSLLDRAFTLKGYTITGIKENGRWLITLQKAGTSSQQANRKRNSLNRYRKQPPSQEKFRKI